MKKQSVTSSILWLTIAEIFFNFSGYIIHASLGRILGPADYGRYGLVVTLTTMIIMLIGNGIPTAMSKYISGFFETDPGMVTKIKKQAALLQAILIGVVTLIFFLSAPLIAKLLGDLSLIPLLKISSLIIPTFAAASFYLYYFIGIHRFNLQAVMKIIRSFARVILVIGLAYFFGLKGSISAYIFAPAIVFLSAWAIDKFWLEKQFAKNSKDSFEWRKLLDYAWPVTLFMLFYELLISLDLYFVKALLGDDSLTGVYNASLTVARIPYYLFYALTMVMLPSISRTTSQNNHLETNRIVSQSLRIMVMLLVPLVISMIVYAQPLIEFFFGSKFSQAETSTQILSFGVGFLTIFYVIAFAMNGAGMVMIPMYISLGGMTFNAVLNFILIPLYGINGSAIATSITSILITVLIFYYAHQRFKSLMKLSSFFKFFLAGLLMLIFSFFLKTDSLLFIPFSAVLCLVYLSMLILLKEFSKEDFNLFKRILLYRKKSQ